MKLVALFILIFSTTTFARGGESSGGVESYKKSYVWFLGKGKKIKWCYVAAPEFPFAESLPRLLEDAFKRWGDYMRFKGIDKASFVPAMDLSLQAKCDGSEDLKVYLGVSDSVVEEAKKHFNRPYAFVEQTTPYDPKKGWSKGLMWIAAPGTVIPDHKPYPAPFYTTVETLEIPILHEVGHILGCEHVEGTIMSEHLGEHLADLTKIDYEDLLRIDQRRELFLSWVPAAGYNAAPMTFLSASFERLVGRPPQGKVIGRFVKTADAFPKGTLTLSDATGDFTFPVEAKKFIVKTEDSATIFHAFVEDEHGGSTEWFLHPETTVWLGALKLRDGSSIAITLSFNVNQQFDQYALLIQALDPGKEFYLFAGLPPGAR